MSYDPLPILDGRGKHLPTDAFSYKTNADGAGQYALDALLSELKDSEIDESKMCVMIPYASGVRRDGVGDLLEIGGIDLSRHRMNSICLLDHGKQTAWPLGMCLERDGTKYDRSKYTVELDPVAQVARANIYFYQGKGFQAGNSFDAEPRKVPLSKEEEFDHALLCEQTFDMVAKRMINGGSIGYQVKRANPLEADYRNGTPQGLHLLETLQLEVSIVVLPANMDTVRKALSDDRCCGKPLSPCLVKSLTPHAAPRKAQMGYEGKKGVQVPLDQDLSKIDVPPARWKPGLGALKELRRKYRKAHHLSTSYAMSGGESHGTHDFREGGEAHTRRALTFTDPSGRVGNFARAGERVKIVSLRPDGSCLIQNEAGQVKHDFTSNLRKNLEGTKSLPALRKKYRKGFRRTLRKSRPGSAMVYVRGKDLEACRGAAEGRGLKFAHTGRHATGLEKVKLHGDDEHIKAVAHEWGRSVKTIQRKSLQGANGMNAKGKDFEQPDTQDEAVELNEPGEKDMGGQEPYGAQARRRVHQDLSILLGEYDRIRQLCEHEQVNAHLEELMQTFAEHLERIESEWDADEDHKELPPIEGAMGDKDMDEEGNSLEEEEPNEPEEEPEEADSSEGKEEEEPEEAAMKGLYRNVKALRKGMCGGCAEGKAAPKDTGRPQNYKKPGAREASRHAPAPHRKFPGGTGGETPVRAVSRGGQRNAKDFDPEDVPGHEEFQDKPGREGTEEDIKLLPHHHRHVGEAHGFLGEVGGMDGAGWGDEQRMKSYHFHKSLENVADELEGADNSSHVPGHEEHQGKPGHEGSEADFEGKAAGPNTPKQRKGERIRAMPSKIVKPEQAWHEDKPKNTKNPKGKDLTEDELNQVEGDLEGSFEDTEEDKHPHVKALRNASGLFHELSGTHELTDEHRVKAMACHKELNPIAHQGRDEMGIPRDGQDEVDVEVGEMGEKMLQNLKKQNDDHAQKMKELNGTIVRLAKLAN